MTTNWTLADILDETVAALRHLDSDALNAVKHRLITVARKFEPHDTGLILSKRRLLEIMLHNCQVNLDALLRLHVRNTRNQWAQ